MSAPISTRPLRVCHVAYSFYERDNRVRRYAEALAARGSHVEVLSLRRADQLRSSMVEGVRVHRLQRRTVSETHAGSYLGKLLSFLARAMVRISRGQVSRPYDVVHVHNVPDFLVFASWLPKLRGARIILDIHDILPELYCDKFHKSTQSWTFRSLRWIERRSTRFADHVIVAGDVWRDKLIERAGLRPEDVTTLLNHPDRRLFRPQPRLVRDSKSPFVMLYPGTLNYHQGVDIAVKAFASVRSRMPDAEFHIYGDGPSLTAIKATVQELGLGDRVRVKPPVPIEEVAGLMARADLGVIPKRADGFGNEAFSTKSLEFMACGVPVVMSRTQVDARHFNESVVRFFEPGAPESLADAMLRDYLDPEGRRSRAERASAFVAELDWTAKVPTYLRIVDGDSADLPSLAAAPPIDHHA